MVDNAAVVVGFNIHGLAIARSLSRAGIAVHALTTDRTLATTVSRYATVHHRSGINSNGIADQLLEFAQTHLCGSAVLFPTNDNMVEAIGTHWSDLRHSYRLSWAGCRELILKLQTKDNLSSFCQRTGVPYPSSRTIRTLAECRELPPAVFRPRVIVKPVRPLSGFKAAIVESVADVERLIMKHSGDLPFVIQDYIDGDQDDLYFCCMYFVEGDEAFAFSGRKIRAVPPNTGQGTIMTGEINEEVIEISRRFCRGLRLSGPIAIEYKRDRQGRYWMIEPNVGRTEYCVDLLIQSGVDVPIIEYEHALGNGMTGIPGRGEPEPRTWYDTERDPLCFLRHVASTRQLRPLGRRPIFPYYGHFDTKPLLRSLQIQMRDLAGRLLKKASRR